MTDFLEKIKLALKKDKKLIVLLVAGVIGIILIVTSEFASAASKTETEIQQQLQQTDGYEQQLEERLCDIVREINGVGNAQVMIKTKGTEENELAQNTASSRTSQGDIKSETEYVIVGAQASRQGVLIKKSYPEIQGAIIVCEGGDDVRIQNEVTNAVSALLGISKNNVAVLKMKYTEEKP